MTQSENSKSGDGSFGEVPQHFPKGTVPMTRTTKSVSLEDVTFTYAGAENPSVRDVDLSIAPGHVVVLAGPSGCGKTTLTRLLSGLVPSFFEGELTGRIRIGEPGEPGELDVTTAASWEVARLVGTVFQNPRTQFFTTDTASELAFGCENLGLPADEIRRRVAAAVAAHGLGELLGRSVFSLSGGQKQRLACGAVAAMETPVVVLDEPSANLDAPSTAGLRQVIATWARSGRTVIVAEHRLHYLCELADEVVVMDQGRIVRRLGGDEFRALSPAEATGLGLRAIRLDDRSVPRGNGSVVRDNGDGSARLVFLDGHTGRLGETNRPRGLGNGSVVPSPGDGSAGLTARPEDAKKTRPVEPSPPPTTPKDAQKNGLELRNIRVRRRLRAVPGQPPARRRVETLRIEAVGFEPGAVTAVIGPNGAGKSTLASVLAGLGPRQPGTLTLGGRPLSWRQRRRACYLVMQDVTHQLFTESVLREVLLADPQRDPERAREALAQVNLGGLEDRHPLSLSAGQRQRLAIACALVSGRPVAVFDEPTSGLDLLQMHAVADALGRLAAHGRIVLVATHDIELIAAVADAVVDLESGRLRDAYPLTAPAWQTLLHRFAALEEAGPKD